jgi:hypothetical protein
VPKVGSWSAQAHGTLSTRQPAARKALHAALMPGSLAKKVLHSVAYAALATTNPQSPAQMRPFRKIELPTTVQSESAEQEFGDIDTNALVATCTAFASASQLRVVLADPSELCPPAPGAPASDNPPDPPPPSPSPAPLPTCEQEQTAKARIGIPRCQQQCILILVILWASASPRPTARSGESPAFRPALPDWTLGFLTDLCRRDPVVSGAAVVPRASSWAGHDCLPPLAKTLTE